ncbi:MAG: GNAT family N-acetyltransferase, partial [Paracoccaceae bacterium]
MTDTPIFDAIDNTWPAARVVSAGPWTLRDGQGGGKRVSAATAKSDIKDSDIPLAESGLVELGQERLFLIRDGEDALDLKLERRGYSVLDPVTAYACPVETLTDIALPRVTVFEIWEPLSIMLEIWQLGGIGPARVAVMQRAKGPKVSLLGRLNERPAGA